jgi:hypothetical protein
MADPSESFCRTFLWNFDNSFSLSAEKLVDKLDEIDKPNEDKMLEADEQIRRYGCEFVMDYSEGRPAACVVFWAQHKGIGQKHVPLRDVRRRLRTLAMKIRLNHHFRKRELRVAQVTIQNVELTLERIESGSMPPAVRAPPFHSVEDTNLAKFVGHGD